MINSHEINSTIKLGILRALLHEVIPSLRAVAFDIDPKSNFVTIFFYHDGKITAAIQNHYSCIDCEASTYFICDNQLIENDFKVIELNYPKELPQHKSWVYMRKEPFIDPEEL